MRKALITILCIAFAIMLVSCTAPPEEQSPLPTPQDNEVENDTDEIDTDIPAPIEGGTDDEDDVTILLPSDDGTDDEDGVTILLPSDDGADDEDDVTILLPSDDGTDDEDGVTIVPPSEDGTDDEDGVTILLPSDDGADDEDGVTILLPSDDGTDGEDDVAIEITSHEGEPTFEIIPQANSTGDGNTTLTMAFTYADWCPPCTKFDENVFPEFKEYMEENHEWFLGTEYYDVDTAEGQAFSRKYGIQSIPTFLIFNAETNELVGRMAGYMDLEEFKQNLLDIYSVFSRN